MTLDEAIRTLFEEETAEVTMYSRSADGKRTCTILVVRGEDLATRLRDLVYEAAKPQ